MQKLCCVCTRQHSLPVWIISSQVHHRISTNSQPFLVGIVSIHVAQDIYGPNLSSLKGKTLWRPLPHLPSSVDPVALDLLERHPSVTIVMDVLFINNIPLLLSMSRELKFMTTEVLPNRQIKTIRDKV